MNYFDQLEKEHNRKKWFKRVGSSLTALVAVGGALIFYLAVAILFQVPL